MENTKLKTSTIVLNEVMAIIRISGFLKKLESLIFTSEHRVEYSVSGFD